MRLLHGIPASPGCATGPAFRFERATPAPVRRVAEDPAVAWDRFQAALDKARDQLRSLQGTLQEAAGEEAAGILQAHLLMADDSVWLERIRQRIFVDHSSAEVALQDASEGYFQQFDALEDPTLRARAADLRDLVARLLRILTGDPLAELAPPRQAILVARDLLPSTVASLVHHGVSGFCTVGGGPNSHAAILARALGIPAVLGLGPELLEVADGTPLALDGDKGTVWIAPDVPIRSRYGARTMQPAPIPIPAHERAVTRDGRRIHLLANLSSEAEVAAALDAGAEGVGVLRTEFLYMGGAGLPGEAEQAQVYGRIAERFGMPVAVRALDLGGDKELPGIPLPATSNPALGQRGVRLSLAHPDRLLEPQLRALLRAAVDHNLRLLLPMVTTVAELRDVRAHLERCREALQAEGIPVPDRLAVGAMIEVPAAALTVDLLASEIDFISIGTNDLVQYLLAADRTNPAVSGLAEGLPISVARVLASAVEMAHRRGLWVEVCGELAGDPAAIPALVDMGVDALSMAPGAIERARAVVRAMGT